jgi:hypothetical protein
MSSRICKPLIPAIVLCMSLAAAGSAAAATVSVTAPGVKSATATTGSQLTITTSARTTATVNCTASTANSTLSSASGPYAVTISTDLAPTFTGCTLPGRVSVGVACTRTSVLAVTADTSGGVTRGTISSISCTITLSSSCGTDVTGSVPGSYNNANDQLTVLTAGQVLVSRPVTGSTCTTLPAGSGAFTNTTGGALIYGVSPATTINATTP